MANSFENIAKKEFLLENSPRVEIASMQNSIRSSMETSQGGNNLSTFLPKDFNPSNDYFFGESIASPIKPTLETRNYNIEDAYAKLNTGEYIAKYDTYKRGRDNAEYAAANQTTGEKWANGVTKALAKTGSAVVGGTAGLVYGVGAALNDGSFSSIYDNSFSNTLADWDEKLSYQLPNYYSKQEQEKGLFGQMGTANFWSDKFLGGLSFTAGAIVSEGIWAYATGGLSLSTAGARLGTRIGRWGVEALGEASALQGLTKYKSLYKTMLEGSIKAGKVSKTLPNAFGKVGELASSVGVLARSAGYEASVEALQYKREATENFYQNFLTTNGREPNEEEISTFKSNLESSANAVFGVNMAILMPSNLVTMGHILDIKSPIKTGFSNFIERKAFGYGIDKTIDTTGKATYKTLQATTGQKIARNVFNYAIKPSLTEGLFEEGLQGVTTKTANKWLEHSYDPKYSNANLDTMGAFYESLGEQYGTKEGWVENGLGMIIGIVGGATNARSENKQKAAELDYQAAVATTFQTTNLQAMLMPNRLQSINRIAGFSEDARKEAQRGNVSRASFAQKSALLTYINAKMVMGESVSDITKEVKMGLDSTTEEQWKDSGITPDLIDTHKESTLAEFEQLAKDWKSNKTYWSYIIGNKIKGEQNLETEIAGDVFGTLNSKNGAIIEALAWQSTIGETANKQMKDTQFAISNEIGSEAINTMLLNSTLRTQNRDLKQQINVATRSYKTELARRDALVAKIAKLNAAPKSPEAANKPAGKQAGALNQALLEAEQKLAELDTELQGYAEQINKTNLYQKELGEINTVTQDLSSDIISGQDLISLQDNLGKLQTTLESMKAVNPQRASYLEELLKEYSDSEEVFLQNQATQRIILNPDFKIEQINSWIQGKVKKNAPMSENTQEWLTDTLKTYQKAKVASMAEQAEAREGEEREARKQAIISELNSIEDPEDPRIKELQAELDDLNKPAEEVEIPEDKGEVKPKSREQEIKDEIEALNVKRTEELSKVQPSRVDEILPKLGNVGNQQMFKNFLNLVAKGKNNLTQEEIDILLKGLSDNSVAVIGGTTDANRNNTERGDLDTAWVNNPSNLQGVELQEFEIALSKLFSWIQVEPNTRQQPEVADESGDGRIQQNATSNPVFIGDLVRSILSNEKVQIENIADKINKKYDSRIQSLQNELEGKAPSQLEVYKKRISEALKGRHNYLTYLGDNYDDVANKKPTQAEVDEFVKLRDEKKFDEPRYQELQQKLSDWKLLDSAVDEEYVSIGDLILGVEQLEQEIEEGETVTEITPEDAPDISDDEGIQASENVVRYDILQNTNGAITVKRKTNGNFTLHHLKIATIAQRMGFDPSVDSLVDEKGNSILFGEEESGSVLTVGGVEFKVIGGNAIEVKESDFMPLQQRLNMYPLNTGATKWSYSDIYTQVGDDFVKMESDFKDDTINSERIYELQEGDRLEVTVNNDGYNDELFSEYESAKGKDKDKALEKLKKNLKLNVTTTKGVIENVSILKALRDEIDENFMRLRERAFDLYMEADDKSNVRLGINVAVDGIFLGSPRFTISEEGKTENSPITERGAKEVIATGYIHNGEIVTNREVKDINKTFVGQLSKKNANKKIPIVVFKRGNYNVAYPVSMNKTGNDLSSLFDSIMSMRISSQEKVRKINQEIQNNKLSTPKLVYEDIYNDKKLEDTRNAFAEVKTFVTADEFADKNYKIDDIVSDASINIDLEDIDSVIQDAKLRIKLDDSIKYSTDRELKYDSMIELEDELNDIARELYKDYTNSASTKYVDSKGDIIEDTGYTETFDDNPIEPATNQLDKVKNINILREAFKGLTPLLKKIIGQDTINKVNTMIKQYDFVKSQITPNSSTVNNGKAKSKCP